jgi:opacity protein-like surface antigen
MTSRFMSRASAAFMCFVAAAAIGPAQAQNFDSAGALRVGAFVQASQYDFELKRPTTILGVPVAGISADSDTFFGGGASIGYDWGARQGLILGLEADASVDESNADYLFTFRGRVGANLQPGWLLYATGGVALLSVEAPDDFNLLGTQVSDASETLTGWTVGGGTELDLHQVTLFAEYLFVDFENLDFKVHNLLGPVIPVSVDVDEQLFRVGAKFKFGDDSARKSLK